MIVTYRNVTDRKSAENALRESSRFNQQIIDNMRDGVAVFDRELHVVSFNPFLENLTGIEADAAIGLQVIDVLPHADRQGLQEALRKALAGETVEMPDVRRDGPLAPSPGAGFACRRCVGRMVRSPECSP